MSGHSAKIINSLSSAYPLLGIALKHHRTTRGMPLSFADKPYLIELYKDFPKIDGADGMKAVQVGWSELLIQLVLERAGFSGRVTAYILPTFQLRDRFVQQRVDPLLSSVPADAAVANNTAVLFVDTSGIFKMKRNDGGTITTHVVTIGADTNE